MISPIRHFLSRCDHCYSSKDTIKEVFGENVCIECGTVQPYPIFLDPIVSHQETEFHPRQVKSQVIPKPVKTHNMTEK
jgi:hypothetical protein